MPKGVFDVFECCEVFVLSIRAIYALTMVFTCANTRWGMVAKVCGRENQGVSDELLPGKLHEGPFAPPDP